MKAINRQIKLISKIDQALKRIKDGTYGFCAETAEPIGLKRLMARPVAELCIAAQEKHEKDEKVYADARVFSRNGSPLLFPSCKAATTSAVTVSSHSYGAGKFPAHPVKSWRRQDRSSQKGSRRLRCWDRMSTLTDGAKHTAFPP